MKMKMRVNNFENQNNRINKKMQELMLIVLTFDRFRFDNTYPFLPCVPGTQYSLMHRSRFRFFVLTNPGTTIMFSLFCFGQGQNIPNVSIHRTDHCFPLDVLDLSGKICMV